MLTIRPLQLGICSVVLLLLLFLKYSCCVLLLCFDMCSPRPLQLLGRLKKRGQLKDNLNATQNATQTQLLRNLMTSDPLLPLIGFLDGAGVLSIDDHSEGE